MPPGRRPASRRGELRRRTQPIDGQRHSRGRGRTRRPLLLVLVVLVLAAFRMTDAPDGGSAAVQDSSTATSTGTLDAPRASVPAVRQEDRPDGFGAATSAALGRLVGHTSPNFCAGRRAAPSICGPSADTCGRRGSPMSRPRMRSDTLHHGHAPPSRPIARYSGTIER